MEDRDFANYIVGQADADSCFVLSIERNSHSKFGVNIVPLWKIDKVGDTELLEKIRDFLGVGKVGPARGKTNPSMALRVHGRDCIRLVTFFEKFQLRGKKRKDFELWKKAVHRYYEKMCRGTGRGLGWRKDELAELLEIRREMDMTLDRRRIGGRRNNPSILLEELSRL